MIELKVMLACFGVFAGLALMTWLFWQAPEGLTRRLRLPSGDAPGARALRRVTLLMWVGAAALLLALTARILVTL